MPTDTPTRDEVLEGIRAELATMQVPGAAGAEPATDFGVLDVDSLDFVELVKALEDRFAIVIPDDRLTTVRTVGQAMDLVLELSSEKAPA